VHFLWVGGSSDSLKATRKEVQELSCEAEVHFVGHRPDVSLYYEASDVFLLTSREDPFPLVMMEAALRGKPIVCFGNSGGAPEFVEEDAGIVVKGFDVEEMAEKLVLLLESDSFRASMGQAGREKVLSRHDINFGAPRIAEAIEAMMQPSRTRQAVLTT
jgi:glycosyltransferase involved in cell wall biosynthesis